MARFPTREADIRALAQNIATGLTDNAAMYPAPPVAPVDLTAILTSLATLSDEAVAARAAAEQITNNKRAALEELTAAMKADIRYCEDTVAYDNAKLGLIGWGAIADGTALQPPGQPRTLESPKQGEGWIFLDWKAPTDGGEVASYKVERRERPAGDWTLVSVALDSEITLNNQERNKDWEYRVISVNKAGESIPSNTVAAVV